MQPRLVEFKRGRKRGSKDKKKRVIGANKTHENIRLGLEGSRQGRRTLSEVLGWLKMFR